MNDNKNERTTISLSREMNEWLRSRGKGISAAINNCLEDYQLGLLMNGVELEGVDDEGKKQIYHRCEIARWMFRRTFLRWNNKKKHWDGFDQAEDLLQSMYEKLEQANADVSEIKRETYQILCGFIENWLKAIEYCQERPFLRRAILRDSLFDHGDGTVSMVRYDTKKISGISNEYFENGMEQMLIQEGEYFDFDNIEYECMLPHADRILICMNRDKVEEIYAYYEGELMEYIFLTPTDKKTYKSVKRMLEKELDIESLETSTWKEEDKVKGITADRTWIKTK